VIFRFDPARRIVAVTAFLSGPLGTTEAELALDTGASRTLISPKLLAFVGCPIPTDAAGLVVTTGSRREIMPKVVVSGVTALGHAVRNFQVLAHQLPASTSVHGLLGLDFFHDCRLEINFRAGTIVLEPPHD